METLTLKKITASEVGQFLKRVQAKEVTAQEFIEFYKQLIASKGEICGELSNRPVSKLTNNPRGRKKSEIVKAIFDQMRDRFLLGRSFSYMPFGDNEGNKETAEEAILKVIETTTDKNLTDYADSITEYRATLEKSLTNPETPDELRRFVEAKGEKALTSEQLAAWDNVKADEVLRSEEWKQDAKARVEAVNTVAEITVKEAVHTKRQCPIWIAQLSVRVDREEYNQLNGAAKRLGGYYSSFGPKENHGFVFFDKALADQFAGIRNGADASARIEARAQERQESQQEHLNRVGLDLIAKGEEIINRPRQVNTHRRATMATHAEAEGRKNIAVGQTMIALAGAVAAGELKYLAKIRTKTQVETLNMILHRARWERVDKEKGQRFEESIPSLKDADFAKYPWPRIDRGNLARYIEMTKTRPGLMRLSARMEKIMDSKTENDSIELHQYGAETLIEFVAACKQNGRPDIADSLCWHLDTFKRVQSLGLTNIWILRAALREYWRARREGPEENKILKAERGLIGCNIPGFFPTPSDLAERMVLMADIEPGMTILEPSAGSGRIADAIKDRFPDADLTCIEPSHTLQNILVLKQHPILLGTTDFLKHRVQADRIIMNPPFENSQDVQHVMHAFNLLKPGGVVVAIMSPAFKYRSGEIYKQFNQLLEATNAEIEDLPEGSFEESGTSVNTVLVKITNP